MEDWVTIRNIKKRNQSLGTRKIARMLGISRNTVRRALVLEEYPIYTRTSKVNEHIEPFTGFIKESYIVRRQRISVIISNLRSKGFAGSDISIYRYIEQHLKAEREIASVRTYMPYSTLPGEHMLYDWSEYTILTGGSLVKIYVHSLLLGYSRYRIYSAGLSIRQSDVFEALEEGFSELGGFCQRLQVDNARVFIDNASITDFRWNERFLSFCGFYGIDPSRSLPGHPWSKGKVENPFDYLENHFITNSSFESFEDFCRKLKMFQREVNERVHTTTKKRPSEMFKGEKEHLMELPGNKHTGEYQRYIGFKEEFRKVTSDCLISFGGNRYSVPHLYARSEVWVRVSKGYYLNIYSQSNKLIAAHVLRVDKGNVVINKEHYRGYRSGSDRRSFAVVSQKLKERFKDYHRIEKFIHSVKVQKRINPSYHLTGICEVFEDYTDSDCTRCMEECFTYNAFSFPFVKGFLMSKAEVKLEVKSISFSLQGYENVNVTRDLREYRI